MIYDLCWILLLNQNKGFMNYDMIAKAPVCVFGNFLNVNELWPWEVLQVEYIPLLKMEATFFDFSQSKFNIINDSEKCNLFIS